MRAAHAARKSPGGLMFRWAALFALLWPTTAGAVVIGAPDIDWSRLMGQSYAGVGKLEITERSGSYRGTGVLLNEQWVLTAAHNWDAGAVTHLAFSINGQRHEASQWVQHPAAQVFRERVFGFA